MHIDENGLIGELDVQYNSDYHYMVVSFRYERKDHEPAPVIIDVEVTGKPYRHVLDACDQCNKLVTAMFKPEYNVWDGIRLCGIGPLVYRDG